MTDKTQAATLRQEYRATMPANVLHLWAKDAIACIAELDALQAAPPAPAAVAVPAPIAAGMKAAADLVQGQADLYITEHAETDPDTGAVIWHHRDYGFDWHNGLEELAQKLLARAALAAAPEQAVAVPEGYDSGIQTGNRVTLCFETQDAATVWFEAFCDSYDAENGTRSIALPLPPAAPAQAVPGGMWTIWESLPGYLIDHCEGETITEEGLQRALEAMLKNPQYSMPPAAPAQEHATQLAGQGHQDYPVLDDDWRRRMLDGSAIARDEMGCGEHPALPVLEEGMKPAQFFDALGIKLVGVMAENQMDGDAYDAMVEAPDYNVWAPEAPAGEGWVLVAIFDTEDGPAAWWMRVAAPDQPSRRNRKAAPVQAQQDARDSAEFNRGFNAATCVALQVLRGFGDTDSAAWNEIVKAAGRAEIENYAKNIEPDNWMLCGFADIASARAAQKGTP